MTRAKSKSAASGGNSAMPAKATGSTDAASSEERRDRTARDFLDPGARHGELAFRYTEALLKGTEEGRAPTFGNFCVEMMRETKRAETGEISIASRLLVAQAISLDGIFTEMARRASYNMREYPQAMEIFMRLALKAQAGSRATLAELVKLHQPREQTVKHIHVNEGGQAVVADQFHTHTGGRENGKTIEQPHATGAGKAGASPALPGSDPLGTGMPIASREGKEAMPDARGQ